MQPIRSQLKKTLSSCLKYFFEGWPQKLQKSYKMKSKTEVWPGYLHLDITKNENPSIFSSPQFPFPQNPSPITLYPHWSEIVFYQNLCFTSNDLPPCSPPPYPLPHSTTCGLASPPVNPPPNRHTHAPLCHFTIPAIALVSYDQCCASWGLLNYPPTPKAKKTHTDTHTVDQHTHPAC